MDVSPKQSIFMGNPPEAFMIFREELAKARFEKERLKKEYEEKIKLLTGDLGNLKEQISSQQEMLQTALNYAMELETRLNEFETRMSLDEKRNSSGYH